MFASIAQGVIVGLLAAGGALLLEMPAPVLIGLIVGLMAMLPYIGITLGSIPLVLLIAGTRSAVAAAVAFALVLVVQALEVFVVRPWVDGATLHVGPAVPVIVVAVGYGVYGVGGALYGAAIAVFLLALADAAATSTESESHAADPPEPKDDDDDGARRRRRDDGAARARGRRGATTRRWPPRCRPARRARTEDYRHAAKVAIAKYWALPPYAWPRDVLAPGIWCSPATPRTWFAASARRSMPDAPIGFHDSTPPEGFTGNLPVISVAPLSTICQPSPGPAMSWPSSHIGSYQLNGT